MVGWKLFIGTITLSGCCIDVVFSESDDCTSRSCGPVNISAETHFRHNINTQIFNRKEWMNFDCCADGFTEIQWEYRTAPNASWQAWPWFEPCEYCDTDIQQFRQLCQQNQSLELISPLPSDSGNYRCTVSNSITGKEVAREFSLIVGECHEDRPDGVQFIGVPDSLSQRAEKGGNVTFTCAGNFGCPTHDPIRLANWSLVNSSGHVHELHPNQNQRYHITYKKSFPYITVSSTLTITDVKESDYSLVFMCSVSTSLVHKTYNLTLHGPQNVVKLNWKAIIIATSALGTVAFLCAILLPVYCSYKPQIDYHYRRHRGTLEPRCEGEENFHDGCIIHSPVNTDFVEDEIKRPLEANNYDIFTKECVSEGRTEGDVADNMGKSMCAIVVLSRAEIEDDSDIISYLFSVAVTSCGSKMVVIEKEDIQSESWREAIRPDALKALPRILKTVRWLGRTKMSRRQHDNFFAEIKLKLPAPKQTQRIANKHSPLRINSDTSTTPLIADSSYPSHQVENGNRNSSQGSRNDSHGLHTLSSSNNGENIAEVDSEHNDEVFNDPSVIPKPSPHIQIKPSPRIQIKPPPQKQISHDSGIATSI